MKGLYAGGDRSKRRPFAMLEAISREEITLTEIGFDAQTTWHLTPAPQLLAPVLRYLHLPETLYTGLGVKPAAERFGPHLAYSAGARLETGASSLTTSSRRIAASAASNAASSSRSKTTS